MESNEHTEQNKQNRDRRIDGEQDDSSGGRLAGGGIGQKGKGLMGMDSVVIAGGAEGVRGLNGNGRNTIKILKMQYKYCMS